MEEPLPIGETHVIPGRELWFTASRAGGPGGQHVNKTSSRVTLHWNLSESDAFDAFQRARLLRRLSNRLSRNGIVLIHVDEYRSQHRNREIARQRLAELVLSALASKKKRIPTKASKAAKRRRLQKKRHRAETKKLRRHPSDDGC
jgi:ribosome-associated protein